MIDDQPVANAFAEKVKSVHGLLLQSAEDSDKPRWEDLFELVSGDAVTFGQTSSRIQGQEKALEKRYDRDRNGRVDDEELVRFLFRDGNVASEFRLFGTDAFRWANRSGSALFVAMDRNADRRLDGDEIKAASESLLRMIDRDSDRCIDLAEATEVADLDENAWQRGRSERQGNVAMDLAGFVNWSNVSYAMGGMLKSGNGVAKVHPVRLLDSDEDRWISAEEAAKVLEQQPSISITVRFNSSDPSATGVEVTVLDGIDGCKIQPVDDQCTWLAESPIEIGVLAIETPTNQNRIPREVFVQLDADQDGAIDENEIPEVAREQFPIEELDTNQDGKLTFLEINQALKQSESIWNYQVRARAAEHPDGVFAWLDTDHDQFLSAREIRTAPSRLLPLLNEDQQLKANEIPDTVVIQFGRGEPEQDDQRFQLVRRTSSRPTDLPRWFTHMDANADGEISETEFLGPIATFGNLDLNGDRFLKPDEALRDQ